MSGVTFEQVEKGQALPRREVRITREAAVSGDHNRIHWDDEWAREVGLPGVIAHGMFTMALASSPVVDWAGPQAFVTEYRTKFTGLVPVPFRGEAVVEVAGVVSKVDAAARRVVVDLTVTHDGEKVLGNARATVQWR